MQRRDGNDAAVQSEYLTSWDYKPRRTSGTAVPRSSGQSDSRTYLLEFISTSGPDSKVKLDT